MAVSVCLKWISTPLGVDVTFSLKCLEVRNRNCNKMWTPKLYHGMNSPTISYSTTYGCYFKYKVTAKLYSRQLKTRQNSLKIYVYIKTWFNQGLELPVLDLFFFDLQRLNVTIEGDTALVSVTAILPTLHTYILYQQLEWLMLYVGSRWTVHGGQPAVLTIITWNARKGRDFCHLAVESKASDKPVEDMSHALSYSSW